MDRTHQAQAKLYINNDDKSKSPFNYSLKIVNLSTSSFNDSAKSALGADH